MSSQDYKDYRRDYEADGLRRQDLALEPWQQFSHWLKDAEKACPQDATSMALATVSASGMPSARMVLMKSYDANGVVWYSDSRSYKGQDIENNPQASILFYWLPLERQVRISGTVTKVPEATSNDYFNSRPRASQLSAAATPQSQVVNCLGDLELNVAQLDEQIQGAIVPRPSAWVGFCLEPTQFEFWQGQPSRLHDRFRYQQIGGAWTIDRLAP
tara:strand:+ start:1302 stop:1946 length:645 start_codon:yes stop_codon:yes gene_type:complete